MKLIQSALIVFATTAFVNAHFLIDYPPVRGPYDEDNGAEFCDGYTNLANRSLFPLTNGLIVWEGTHPQWTIGVTISTATSPTSFNDFRTSSGADQLVVDYFQGTGASGCIRVEPTKAGISSIQNGSNVTFQMMYDNGEVKNYQCMDVTLDSNLPVPVNVSCLDLEGQPPTSSTGSGSPSSTQPESSSSVGSGGPPSQTSTGLPSSGGRAVSTAVSEFLGLGLACVVAAVLA